ncbi:MmyB family transcriptional regulator [Nonomuraea sp. NPDC004354]
MQAIVLPAGGGRDHDEDGDADAYIRLEQGQSRNASDGVLDALARALRLDETARLYSLARPTKARRKKIRPERLRPGLAVMIESFGMVPAYVIGRRSDVLGWNRMAHALLAGHLDFDAPRLAEDRPNIPADAGRRLVVINARPGSSSAAALRLLADLHPLPPERSSWSPKPGMPRSAPDEASGRTPPGVDGRRLPRGRGTQEQP